jgi:hypothetical protein
MYLNKESYIHCMALLPTSYSTDTIFEYFRYYGAVHVADALDYAEATVTDGRGQYIIMDLAKKTYTGTPTTLFMPITVTVARREYFTKWSWACFFSCISDVAPIMLRTRPLCVKDNKLWWEGWPMCNNNGHSMHKKLNA